MGGPPVFQRSPRLRPELPAGEVEIPAPPAAPHEPAMSLTSVFLSLLPGLLGAVLMYGLARSRGGGSPSYLLYSLPMMAVGYLAQLGHFWGQKRKYADAVCQRERVYRDLLCKERQGLDRERQRQQSAMRETDPDPAELLGRTAARDPRLWERSPKDGDFLALRLGLGQVPFGISLKLPRPGTALDADPLLQEAQALGSEYAEVPGVPIRLRLRDAGAAGIVGERGAVLSALQAAVMQIATHHSPDDVKMVALFAADEAQEWAGMRWLPHLWSDDRQTRWLAADPETAHRLLTDLYDELCRRKLQGLKEASPALVFLVGDRSLIQNEPLMPLLLREGPSVGAYALVVAARREDLPMECTAIAMIDGARSRLIETTPFLRQQAFIPDVAKAGQLDALARNLAPVRPHRLAGPAEIPRQVSLLETLAVTRVDELNVPLRWRASEPFRSLAAPIGAKAGGERLLLDLHERAHGPHGLVAGATGSGKSELLQTLIAALAVSFHPHELAFVMIDYKGGGMANAFRCLPHLTGTITNLEGGLARRALAALKSELKRRQRQLGEAGVSHIDEYIRMRRQGLVSEPLPHLVLVVDEFAELKAEQPEFMRELISAVRVGRSLGIHLILATQKPAGVVDEQIWSNTRFRLCLRVERPGDSQEVLRCPDAAAITSAGRAYFQVGNNERFELFQAGWGGAPHGQQLIDPYAVSEVGLDGHRHAIGPERPPSASVTRTQLDVLIDHLQRVAEEAGLSPVPSPWLAPLPAEVSLQPDSGSWMDVAVGLADDPENQRQEPLRINLGKEGHLAVYGAPGTGKTTFLQTLVVSLARSHTPQQVHIYLMDGSGRALKLMEQLAHVGAVVTVDETERVGRLLRFLVHELDRRKERLARLGVNTLAAYRQACDDDLPAILLAIDNFPVLTGAHEGSEEAIARVAREGGNLGIHLVLTAGSPSAMRHRVGSNITMAVTFSLVDRSEYGMAAGRTGGLEPANLPGRGLVKGAPPLEFQTALPVAGETEWERSAALRLFCEETDRAWTGPRPKPILALPEVVPMAADGSLGLDVETLDPFAPALADGPHFVITGPAGAGKSNLLRAWTRAIGGQAEVWLVDPGMGSLAGLRQEPGVKGYCSDAESLCRAVSQIAEIVQDRRLQSAEGPPLLMVIDDYDLFRSLATDEVKAKLENLIRRERGPGFHVMAAGPSAVFGQYGYEGLTKALLELQTGFVLGSNEHSDLGVLGLPVPSGAPRRLPPGQGYFARRGRLRAVKIALVNEAFVGKGGM